MTPHARAISIVHRVACARGWTVDDLMSHAKRCAPARAEAYRALVSEMDWSHSQIARLFDRDRSAVTWALAQPVREIPSAERVDDMERQLRRLAGCETAHAVASKLNIKTWQAIWLSILIEAYPRVLNYEVLCELYDEACARLHFGYRKGAHLAQAKIFVYRTRINLMEQGLPQPVKTVPPEGYVLTDEMALWCANNLGRPFIPGVALHRMAAA